MVHDTSQKGVCSSNLTLPNVYLLGGQIPPRLQISGPVLSLSSVIDSKNKTPPLNIAAVLVCSLEQTPSPSPTAADRRFLQTAWRIRASLHPRSFTAPCVLRRCGIQSPFPVAIPTAWSASRPTGTSLTTWGCTVVPSAAPPSRRAPC